ncbi:MAG TPA: radical SAM/SPASM domain-containing protein [Cellvibrionaceae bacterium]|nr:radical SAM/SPASM domain-containing protein [Cellvibrionaceae bacterium]HNG60356.1 radical SAM/SPASM domain-containing protein [Cellvibrionaceae bacterium]
MEFAQIEITTRCNFTCGFCAGRHMPQRDFSRADFNAILAQWPNLTAIELQGEGEPLIHPDFFALVNDAKHHCPDAVLSTISNGSLLNASNIEQLLQSPLDHLWISLETLNPLDFKRLRGGKLSRVLRGLRSLLVAKRALAADLKIGFAVTLLHGHSHQLQAISRLYHALGMDGGISLQGLQTMPAYQQHYSAELIAELLQPQDNQVIKQLIASDSQVKRALFDYARQGSFYARMYQKAGAHCCPWLTLGLYIDVQGRVMSCCFSKNPQQALGHFTQLTQVLKARRAMAQSLAAGTIPSPCSGCGIAQQLCSAKTLSV